MAGNPPLMYACVSGNMELAKVLVTKTGADINQRNNMYLTPLVVACSYGSNDVVELLVHAGAVLDFRSTCQRTALFFAILYGYPECVKTLLKFGANMDLQDSIRKTPIDYAIEKQKKAETEEDKLKYGEILKLLANPPKRVTLSRFSKSNQLKNTCRNKIRQLLNSSPRDHLFTKKVKLLPLPNELKEYLQGNSTQSLNDALRLHP
nr:ankyrin repeat domain-containing protein [Endozoicomonas atrinae]